MAISVKLRATSVCRRPSADRVPSTFLSSPPHPAITAHSRIISVQTGCEEPCFMVHLHYYQPSSFDDAKFLVDPISKRQQAICNSIVANGPKHATPSAPLGLDKLSGTWDTFPPDADR